MRRRGQMLLSRVDRADFIEERVKVDRLAAEPGLLDLNVGGESGWINLVRVTGKHGEVRELADLNRPDFVVTVQ
jgi:hypothetical protein